MKTILTKKNMLLLLLLSIFVAGCNSSEEQVQTAIAQTQLAQPTITRTHTPAPSNTPVLTSTPEFTSTPLATFTPTNIPLSEINLEEYLIKNGDLPAGYSGAQIYSHYPPFLDKMNMPEAEYIVGQQLAKQGDRAGSVDVWVYKDSSTAREAYNLVASTFGDDVETGVLGDTDVEFSRIVFDLSALGAAKGMDMASLHCNTVTYIRITGTTDVISVETYIERVIGRIAEIVGCVP